MKYTILCMLCAVVQAEYVTNFPGLSVLFDANRTKPFIPYDNTTCAGRCCRSVAVTQACLKDWTQCAAGGTMSPCVSSQQLSSGCSAWVPCDTNDRHNAMGALVGFGLVSCLCCLYLIFMWLRHGYTVASKLTPLMFDIEYYPWFMLAVLTILSILGLAACSDYDQFTSANGVRMDFIAVQSCVASCLEGFGASGTSSLFCGDKAYDLTGFVTPDFNVSKFRCS